MSNDYQQLMASGRPHPLKDVPQEVLNVARIAMAEMQEELHDREMVDMADALIMALHAAGFIVIPEQES